ncbi:MAG: ABC transporter substrate-binding protein [Phycisphaerae bacterium]|nr:ABC transporter substrate-binding protein [Phycisphaerae bacterium]
MTILLSALVGCDKPVPRDDTPRPRIITYSPALTTIMFDMGLGDHVVGVSEYSVLPPGQERPVVGDTRNIRTEPILALRPDVILTQSELKHYETVKQFQPSLKIEHFPLTNLEEVAVAMERIGRIVDQPDLGLARAEAFRKRLDAVKEKTKSLPKRRVLFVMDYQHPFAAGGETFLDEMIRLAGGVNVLTGTRDWHKPAVETILQAKPDIIVCQCKPSQADEAKRYWSELLAKTNTPVEVYTVTDDTWTIAAGHLADHTEQLADMIHPEIRDE